MSFLSDWWEAAVISGCYVWGTPWPRAKSRGTGGGRHPTCISPRNDQAGSLGIEEKMS
jgi:hypothetical protein